MTTSALSIITGGMRCNRTILTSDVSLVYITNPLDYHQPIQLKVEGLNINHLLALVVYHVHELQAEMVECNKHKQDACMMDEEEFSFRLIHELGVSILLLNEHAKLCITATPHVVYNHQSGVTVHGTYPDEHKLYPQTQLTLWEKGIEITCQYVNDLTLRTK